MQSVELQLNELSYVSPVNSTLTYCCLSNVILQMVVFGMCIFELQSLLFLLSKHSSSLQDEMLDSEAWC